MSKKKKPSVNRETLLLLAELQGQTRRNLNFSVILSECFERNFPAGDGTLQGTPRRIAGLLGWDTATVSGLFERLIALPGGGNAALRARKVEGKPSEICFYSEAVENSLRKICARSEIREQSKENRRAARESEKAKSGADSSNPAGNADGAQTVLFAPKIAKSKKDVLKLLEEAHENYARKGNTENCNRIGQVWHAVSDAPESEISAILARDAPEIKYAPPVA